jgi:uncharacterized protein YndB with AHSA1/START domain
MPQAQRSIVIDRPIADVFGFFTDPANDKKWRTHVKEISSSGVPAVGGTIHQVIAGPGGRGIPADIEITAYDPGSRYAFKVVAGPARPQGEYTFAPAGNGTSVTFSLSAELTGIKKLLMAGQVQKSMDGEMKSLDTAKQLLEQG